MALKSDVESLFGYRLHYKQTPMELQQRILDELWPSHVSLGVLGFGAEACVLKTSSWEDERKKRRNTYAVKIAAQEFVRKDYELTNFYTKRVEKINHERLRFLNGINCQRLASSMPKSLVSLVVPRIIEVKEEPWLSFVMEFVEGIPLLQWLSESKDFEESMLLYMQLLKGVKELHDINLIHRDIKPENIKVCGNLQINKKLSLLDWTSSKLLGVEWNNTLIGTSLGTVPYASDRNTVEGKAGEANLEDDVEPLAVMVYEFSNFEKVPKPDFCRPEEIATNKDMKKRYRSWIRESVPERLQPVFDCAGTAREIGELIFALEKAFLSMDFNTQAKTVVEETSLVARVERLEKALGIFVDALKKI